MNGRKDNVYYQEKKIVFTDFDVTGKLRVSSLLRFTSNLAIEDYSDRGCSGEELIRRGIMFLVAGVHIRVDRDLKDNEYVTIATYERGVKGAGCIRDYFILDGSGEMPVVGASSWILVDAGRRRILRPSSDRIPWKMQENPCLIDCEDYSRIIMPEDMEEAGAREIRFSDLDINGHVNNSIYGDMASDVLPRRIFEKGYTDVSVTYHSEASLGNTLSLSRFCDETRAVVRAVKEDGRTCFDIEIKGDFS